MLVYLFVHFYCLFVAWVILCSSDTAVAVVILSVTVLILWMMWSPHLYWYMMTLRVPVRELKNIFETWQLEWHFGWYLRRGAPLAVALVNGQEPRLTSIVEGGRPWNGLFPIHIPLLVSNPWRRHPMGPADQRGPNMFSSINGERNQKKPLINKKLVGEFLYQHYFSESYILSSNWGVAKVI